MWKLSLVLVVALVCSGCSALRIIGLGGGQTSVSDAQEGPQDATQSSVAKQVGRFAWIAVPAIVGGVVMSFMGLLKPGLTVAGGGSVLLVVSMAVAKYAAWIELGGIALIIGLCVWLVISKTSLLSKYKTALAEVVKGVEAVKDKLLPDDDTKKEANNILAGVQLGETPDLVDEIKSEA